MTMNEMKRKRKQFETSSFLLCLVLFLFLFLSSSLRFSTNDTVSIGSGKNGSHNNSGRRRDTPEHCHNDDDIQDPSDSSQFDFVVDVESVTTKTTTTVMMMVPLVPLLLLLLLLMVLVVAGTGTGGIMARLRTPEQKRKKTTKRKQCQLCGLAYSSGSSSTSSSWTSSFLWWIIVAVIAAASITTRRRMLLESTQHVLLLLLVLFLSATMPPNTPHRPNVSRIPTKMTMTIMMMMTTTTTTTTTTTFALMHRPLRSLYSSSSFRGMTPPLSSAFGDPMSSTVSSQAPSFLTSSPFSWRQRQRKRKRQKQIQRPTTSFGIWQDAPQDDDEIRNVATTKTSTATDSTVKTKTSMKPTTGTKSTPASRSDGAMWTMTNSPSSSSASASWDVDDDAAASRVLVSDEKGDNDDEDDDEEEREEAEEASAILLDSGPGTGKSYALACRVAHLLRGDVEQDDKNKSNNDTFTSFQRKRKNAHPCHPSQMILLSFTNRDARRLQSEALRQLFGHDDNHPPPPPHEAKNGKMMATSKYGGRRDVNPGSAANANATAIIQGMTKSELAQQLWCGTVHSFCIRLLHSYASRTLRRNKWQNRRQGRRASTETVTTTTTTTRGRSSQPQPETPSSAESSDSASSSFSQPTQSPTSKTTPLAVQHIRVLSESERRKRIDQCLRIILDPSNYHPSTGEGAGEGGRGRDSSHPQYLRDAMSLRTRRYLYVNAMKELHQSRTTLVKQMSHCIQLWKESQILPPPALWNLNVEDYMDHDGRKGVRTKTEVDDDGHDDLLLLRRQQELLNQCMALSMRVGHSQIVTRLAWEIYADYQALQIRTDGGATLDPADLASFTCCVLRYDHRQQKQQNSRRDHTHQEDTRPSSSSSSETSSSSFLDTIRAQLRHVFVDEYQDLSVSQHALVRLIVRGDEDDGRDDKFSTSAAAASALESTSTLTLASMMKRRTTGTVPVSASARPDADSGPKLFCCGDRQQSIYGWRGATPSHTMDGFQMDYPRGVVIPLGTNYRIPTDLWRSAHQLLLTTSSKRTSTATGEWKDDDDPNQTTDDMIGRDQTTAATTAAAAAAATTPKPTAAESMTFDHQQQRHHHLGGVKTYPKSPVGRDLRVQHFRRQLLERRQQQQQQRQENQKQQRQHLHTDSLPHDDHSDGSNHDEPPPESSTGVDRTTDIIHHHMDFDFDYYDDDDDDDDFADAPVYIQGFWDEREEAKQIAFKIRKRSRERLQRMTASLKRLAGPSPSQNGKKTGQKKAPSTAATSSDPTDVAVIVRTTQQIHLMEEALTNAAIPCVVIREGRRSHDEKTTRMGSRRNLVGRGAAVGNWDPTSSPRAGGATRNEEAAAAIPTTKAPVKPRVMMKPVRVLTMHGAKGHEFDEVYLPGWTEGVFPHPTQSSSSSSSSPSPSPSRQMEEERRLAFVALSRARQRVVITHSFVRNDVTYVRDDNNNNKTNFRRGRSVSNTRRRVTRPVRPSPFLYELLPEARTQPHRKLVTHSQIMQTQRRPKPTTDQDEKETTAAAEAESDSGDGGSNGRPKLYPAIVWNRSRGSKGMMAGENLPSHFANSYRVPPGYSRQHPVGGRRSADDKNETAMTRPMSQPAPPRRTNTPHNLAIPRPKSEDEREWLQQTTESSNGVEVSDQSATRIGTISTLDAHHSEDSCDPIKTPARDDDDKNMTLLESKKTEEEGEENHDHHRDANRGEMVPKNDDAPCQSRSSPHRRQQQQSNPPEVEKEEEKETCERSTVAHAVSTTEENVSSSRKAAKSVNPATSAIMNATGRRHEDAPSHFSSSSSKEAEEEEEGSPLSTAVAMAFEDTSSSSPLSSSLPPATDNPAVEKDDLLQPIVTALADLLLADAGGTRRNGIKEHRHRVKTVFLGMLRDVSGMKRGSILVFPAVESALLEEKNDDRSRTESRLKDVLLHDDNNSFSMAAAAAKKRQRSRASALQLGIYLVYLVKTEGSSLEVGGD